MPSVLIVDDDQDVQRLLQLLLSTHGYQTSCASNGAEALDAMRKHRPCAVLLDMNMPVKDGYEFRSDQLADETLREVPVICMTAHYEPAQVVSRIGTPCLRKPLNFPDLLGAIRGACGEGHESAAP